MKLILCFSTEKCKLVLVRPVKNFRSRGLLPVYDMEVPQTMYRHEAQGQNEVDDVVHLMLRVVVSRVDGR